MPFGRESAVEQVRQLRIRDRIVRHVDPDSKTKAARCRLEKDLGKWLRFHGGEAFDRPWSADHLKVLGKIETAVNSGGLFALAMPRGHGKSTIMKWVAAYVLLTGRRKYLVMIAATAELAQSIVDFVRQQITENETLHAHYPHVTSYARATDGKAIKARYQLRADGKASGILWSKTTLVFPEVLDAAGKPYRSNGAILEAHGLTGAIRGKWKDTKTGKVLRPDFVILDDPQDRSSAESPTQCSMRERIITGDVLGLAGPRRRIAAVMPCTIIRKGDLADRFLNHKQHPEWQGEICRLVDAWPAEQDGLWKEYERIYREETGEGRGFALATEFSRTRREAMDAGAVVSWASRVRDGELSALQTAENLRIEAGPQFWAEYQNDPRDIELSQYELTAEAIARHTAPLPRLQLPSATTFLVGMIDINPRAGGLHWAMAAFDQTMTGHCPAYGKWPERGNMVEKNASEQAIQVAIFRHLKELCDQIAGMAFTRDNARINPSLILIDCAYMPDAVQRFAQQSRYAFKVVPSIGRDSKGYRVKPDTLVGRPFENCHVQRAQKIGHGPYLMFHSDYWREVMQRAFLGTAGERGGFTLYQPDGRANHVDFAEQVCAEKLAHKGDIGGGLRWEWHHQPGAKWDWGDALTGCWVAAAASGLSASGQPAPAPAPFRNMRQVRHIAI
jgi:hypothetical protein